MPGFIPSGAHSDWAYYFELHRIESAQFVFDAASARNEGLGWLSVFSRFDERTLVCNAVLWRCVIT